MFENKIRPVLLWESLKKIKLWEIFSGRFLFDKFEEQFRTNDARGPNSDVGWGSFWKTVYYLLLKHIFIITYWNIEVINFIRASFYSPPAKKSINHSLVNFVLLKSHYLTALFECLEDLKKEWKKERPTAYLYTFKTKTFVFIKLKNHYQTIKNFKIV